MNFYELTVIYVVLQLLFQEKNPGIKYEYIIKKTKVTGNEVIEPIYRWRYGAWTDCSTTCGLGWCSTVKRIIIKLCGSLKVLSNNFLPVLGEQHQPVRCFEMDEGVVDEALCDPENRPEDRHRKCKTMDCPARSLLSNKSLFFCQHYGLKTFCTVVSVRQSLHCLI